MSYVDGKKYEQRRSQYAELRAASDAICRKYRLSVLEQPGGKTSRALYQAERRGEPTRYAQMRAAIRYAMRETSTEADFATVLRERGFGSKRYLNDYIQYVTSDFLAGLGFGATQMLGESEGIYIGYSLDTGRNVYLKPALASQGVKGSVTNALAAAFVGSLGGGKSFSNNMIVYYSVLFGAQALIVDPKAERGRWKETLPEITHEINIVNLTSEEQNRGLLDPYVIMEKPKDSESLAIDILTFLTGISSRDGEKFPVLRKAIRAVTNSEERGLFKVIEELRAEGTAISTSIADHIESFTDYDFAHLLFSDGDVTQSISLEKQLNIIQVADLVLPDKETSFEEYTTMELLSVAMLIVISTFALDFIHTDRSVFKIVDLDEAWSFLPVSYTHLDVYKRQNDYLYTSFVKPVAYSMDGYYFLKFNLAYAAIHPLTQEE